MTNAYSKAFVGIHRSERRGTLIYVLIDDRAAFDLIDLPEGGNEKVRHKATNDGVTDVIFQHWLKTTHSQDSECTVSSATDLCNSLRSAAR